MSIKSKNSKPTRYGTLSAADTFLQIFMICLQRLAQSVRVDMFHICLISDIDLNLNINIACLPHLPG